MTPYAIAVGDIKPRHIALLEQVKSVVESLADGLTCHEVCAEVVWQLSGLVWMEGKFAGFDHSWLEVSNERVIIDAYPWASHTPFLVVNQTGSPWAVLYRGTPARHNGLGGITNAERNRTAEPSQTT